MGRDFIDTFGGWPMCLVSVSKSHLPLGSSSMTAANTSLLSLNTQPQGRNGILLFLPHGIGMTKLKLGSHNTLQEAKE